MLRLREAPREEPEMLRTVIQPVKHGLIVHLTTLFGPPFGEIHREPDVLWFRTGDPDPYRNGILDAVLTPDRQGEQIDRLLEPFKAEEQPMMWWFFTGPLGLRPFTHRLLIDRGLFVESDRPAMTLDLSRYSPFTLPRNLEVRRVENEDEFRWWVDVAADAFQTPNRYASISTLSFKSQGFGEDAPFQHYVSLLSGTPVGSATMTLAGDVSSFGNIGTRRDFRRRGIARATLGRALSDARRRGLSIASLSADPEGALLYRDLGFETVGRHLTYVWKP